jgi:hypothetical protein
MSHEETEEVFLDEEEPTGEASLLDVELAVSVDRLRKEAEEAEEAAWVEHRAKLDARDVEIANEAKAQRVERTRRASLAALAFATRTGMTPVQVAGVAQVAADAFEALRVVPTLPSTPCVDLADIQARCAVIVAAERRYETARDVLAGLLATSDPAKVDPAKLAEEAYALAGAS